MRLKSEYNSPEERLSLLNLHQNLILIEEQNIKEGNFLIFSDSPPEKEIVYVNVPEKEFTDLQTENTQIKEQQVQLSSDFQGLTDLLAGNGVI